MILTPRHNHYSHKCFKKYERRSLPVTSRCPWRNGHTFRVEVRYEEGVYIGLCPEIGCFTQMDTYASLLRVTKFLGREIAAENGCRGRIRLVFDPEPCKTTTSA
jgi:hypothetical protein